MFSFRVDANKSGTITPAELQKALVNGNGTEFNMVTIDSMISKIFKGTGNCFNVIMTTTASRSV